MRMHQAARWQVFAKQPLETLPRQPVSLAPTHQSVSPRATNFPAESSQSSQIVWHRMVTALALEVFIQVAFKIRCDSAIFRSSDLPPSRPRREPRGGRPAAN